MNSIKPELFLVGAGPGDPDLITIKAVKALQTAKVILYDALVNESLLSHAQEGVQKIFVGKRAGLHHLQQKEINRMIVKYAHSHGQVVRLKGGDPYVFGRGHEELEYAARHGIPTQYIPGISSAMAVPGLSGIPLTKRGVNESFWVVTGTLMDGSFSKDLHMAAQTTATVIVLMGTKKFPQIVALFKKYRGEDEGIALLQNGSLKKQKTVIGNLGNILHSEQKNPILAPAIIVVGKVVKEKQGLGNFLDKRALQLH